eukprot:TRINITY_DN9248_c0_g1_i1.p1 TRINITY_DN9248_c0_g1~~TRINITY_DN9248_c0_g1_i1.p1  ORF type:complete len:146 (+),score=27.76 TRINITY_DN9248_c0_g1_i1:45-482(+)
MADGILRLEGTCGRLWNGIQQQPNFVLAPLPTDGLFFNWDGTNFSKISQQLHQRCLGCRGHSLQERLHFLSLHCQHPRCSSNEQQQDTVVALQEGGRPGCPLQMVTNLTSSYHMQQMANGIWINGFARQPKKKKKKVLCVDTCLL